MPSPLQKAVLPEDVTIASGAALTAGINLKGRVLAGIIMPSSWTTANLTLQACATEAGTYVDVYSTAGTEYAITAAASRYLAIDITQTRGLNFIKVRSGTTGTPVNQGADRTLTLMLARPE